MSKVSNELLERRAQLHEEATAVSERIHACGDKATKLQGLVERLATLAREEANVPPADRAPMEAERKKLLAREDALDKSGSGGESLEALRARERQLCGELTEVKSQLLAGQVAKLKKHVEAELTKHDEICLSCALDAAARIVAWKLAILKLANRPDFVRAGMQNQLREFAEMQLRVRSGTYEPKRMKKVSVDVEKQLTKIFSV